jgi:DNA-binding MarR family transcriptional regulator
MAQEDNGRDKLIEVLDASIAGFNKDGRAGRKRATRRARRLTHMDWTYSALLILEGMKDNPTMRMSQLAEYVGTTPPTVTKLVRDLESKGLVDKTPDELDGRASIINLTDAGHQVAESIIRARIAGLSEVLTGWTVEDLEVFTALFERLQADMRRMS